MDIAQLIDISLANGDERRVEVMSLEPAEVPARAVGSLVGLLTEVTGVLLAARSGREDQGHRFLEQATPTGFRSPHRLETSVMG